MVDPQVTVNGMAVTLAATAPHTSLLDAVRGHGATGSKEGCAEGECGACAVLVARPRVDGLPGTQWVAVNSCLPPALSYVGQQVVTAEGLGAPGALHPVQSALGSRGGSQCGYCTPGFVVSMAGEFYRERQPGEGFDVESLSGNLCRCTGYRPILEAAQALTEPDADDPMARRRAQQPPAAPPVDQRDSAGAQRFVRPATLDEALQVLADEPHAVPVAGATDLGVLVNLAMLRPPVLVAIDRLPELRELSVGEHQVRIGAALSLTEIEHQLRGRVPLLAALFPQFSSRLIRNAATLGGNLGTASPIGDSPPALLALDAIVELAGPDGRREVALVDYFTGYRTTVRRDGELIVAVRFALPAPGVTAFHKIAKRRLDDISSVAVAYQLVVEGGVVTQARIGLGGVAATPLRATATEQALLGRPWSRETVEAAAAVLAGEGTPMSDHRASAAYRSAMLGTSLPRLFHEQPTTPEVTR
jgi:xanthine dehydrogenase small subunit